MLHSSQEVSLLATWWHPCRYDRIFKANSKPEKGILTHPIKCSSSDEVYMKHYAIDL